MEEVGTDTNKKKINSNLFLFDDVYHKLKANQNEIRCKSASIHKKITFNLNLKNNLTKGKEENKQIYYRNNNFFSNDLLKKEKNNTIELQLFSPNNNNKLNSNIKTINLSNLIKTNDSMKIDTTKQTSKRTRIFSGKYNSSHSFYNLSNSIQKENKKFLGLKKDKTKNRNHFSIININVDNNDTKEKINKTTLKDLELQKLLKKSKTIKFDKILNSNKNKINKENIKFLDFISSPFSYYLKKEKKYNIEKNVEKNKDESKNSYINLKKNYPIKYSFFDNTMNKIYHMVKFVDMENKEEISQNVILDSKYENQYKFHDFKIYGYELSPEIIYKINQDEKQKLIKIELEKLKKNNMFENFNEIKARKNQRTKFKKNYIPEFKLKFKNPSLKNKHYESIYKFHPIKYTPCPRKSAILKKKVIKNKFSLTNLEKHNSLIVHSKKQKFIDNLIKERNNEKKSKSLKIDFLKNKKIKSLLKNNEFKKHDNNYLDNEKDKKIEEETKNIQKGNDLINSDQIVKIDDKDKTKSENNNTKVINDNTSNKINISNINNNLNMNIYNYIPNIVQKQVSKDYNKTNQIAKEMDIFLMGNDSDKDDSLDISDYVDKINSVKRYKNRNSVGFFGGNNFITSAKNLTKQRISNVSLKKKNRKSSKRKSTKSTFSKEFNEKSSSIFNLDEENKSKINKPQKIKKETNVDDKSKKETKIESKKINVYLNKNDSNLIREVKNDPSFQKKLFEEINNENKLQENKKTYKPFYQTEKELLGNYNKIEEINNFEYKSKYYKKRIKPRQKKIRKQDKITKTQNKRNILKNQESSKNEEEEEERDFAKELEERISILKGKRGMKKSVTLDFIKQKYKEIEERKGQVDINEELTLNIEKLNSFNNIDLDSVEDIEYGKNVLLHKLREDIRYKILAGKCEKSEMDEFLKFENKINDYKINYNLKDENKIKEYVLLVLVKINEFIELLRIREGKKNEENRINKFINDLNYELDYNVPMLLSFKGKKCYSRNYSGYIPILSELKK